MIELIYRSFCASMALMTVLPVPYPASISAQEQRRTIYLYPLARLVIGILLWVLIVLLPDSPMLVSAMVLTVWVVLTGALHLDGLADCADAWMGGLSDREKTLRILKDPLCGAMAVVTLIMILLVKFAALAAILQQEGQLLLLVIPVLARCTPLYLFWRLDYVRIGGLGSSLSPVKTDLPWLKVVLAIVILLTLISAGWSALLLLALVLALCMLVSHASRRRLGGFTGDVAGALIELSECALCVWVAFDYL